MDLVHFGPKNVLISDAPRIKNKLPNVPLVIETTYYSNKSK